MFSLKDFLGLMLAAVPLTVLFAALLSVTPAHAADIETTPAANAESRDYVAGKRAVENKDWNSAIESFRKVVVKEPKNADAYTMLGYSLRWAGRMEEAFVAYGQALKLDPKHRGAHEYLGKAYLKAGQLADAEAQLATLERIAGRNAEEYRDLAKAIADFKAGKS